MDDSAGNGATNTQENGKPPAHLSQKMKNFWEWAHKARKNIPPSDELILLQACQSHDRAEQARRAIKKNGMTCKDRFGQERARPELEVERTSRAQFVKFTQALHLHVGEPW